MLYRASELPNFTGRTLEGVALRYERPSRVTDDNWKSSYYEQVKRGSTANSLRDKVEYPVYRQHQQYSPDALGTVTFSHSDDESALIFTAQIERSALGDSLLEDVKSGEWGDVSIGFQALRSSKIRKVIGEIVSRDEIRLNELSVTASGSGLVSGAEVQVIRATTHPMTMSKRELDKALALMLRP